MTDQQLLERQVRETLTTRADGVAATPALYERVRRGIRRDRRWSLTRAWAMLATIVVLAGLVIVALPDETNVDIVDDPADTTRDDGDADADDDGADTALPSDQPFGGVGFAVQDDDGLIVFTPDGSTLLEAPAAMGQAVDLAVAAGWSSDDGVVVALVETADGGREVHTHRMTEQSVPRVETLLVGSPEGDRIAVLPDGSGAVWLEDLDLVVKPITPGRGSSPMATSLDLPPDGPASLVAQQVVAHDDGSLSLLATDPDQLQAWSIPLRPSDRPGMYDVDFVPAPMPGFGSVLDIVSLPDGSLLSLEAPVDGDVPFLRRTTFGPPGSDQVHPLPDLLWPNGGGELDSGGGWQVTLHDGERGIVHRYLIDPDASNSESLAATRGAGVGVAGVHVGADADAWAGSGDDWRDGLEAAMEQARRERLAAAHAVVDALQAEIAALEARLDQETAEDEAQELEQQIAELRRALVRETDVLHAVELDLEVRRLEEASRQSPSPTDG